MNAITKLLDMFGMEAKNHKRDLPGPSLTTRAWDNMDAPAHSLQHLENSVKGVRDAMLGGFSRGIKMSKLDLENCMEDFRSL
jgi:hypothetical protein